MNSYLKQATRVSLSTASGILLFLSFPSFNYFLLEWVALVPLLFAIEGLSLRHTYLLGLITGMVAVAGGFYWMVNWAETAIGLLFPFNLMFGLGHAFAAGQVFGIAVFLFQCLRRQNKSYDILL
ncbi:hypothetical protein KKA14_21415, partial [bacterium]|nr:hypothetical protein [bacterium]